MKLFVSMVDDNEDAKIVVGVDFVNMVGCVLNAKIVEAVDFVNKVDVNIMCTLLSGMTTTINCKKCYIEIVDNKAESGSNFSNYGSSESAPTLIKMRID